MTTQASASQLIGCPSHTYQALASNAHVQRARPASRPILDHWQQFGHKVETLGLARQTAWVHGIDVGKPFVIAIAVWFVVEHRALLVPVVCGHLTRLWIGVLVGGKNHSSFRTCGLHILCLSWLPWHPDLERHFLNDVDMPPLQLLHWKHNEQRTWMDTFDRTNLEHGDHALQSDHSEGWLSFSGSNRMY